MPNKAETHERLIHDNVALQSLQCRSVGGMLDLRKPLSSRDELKDEARRGHQECLEVRY